MYKQAFILLYLYLILFNFQVARAIYDKDNFFPRYSFTRYAVSLTLHFLLCAFKSLYGCEKEEEKNTNKEIAIIIEC